MKAQMNELRVGFAQVSIIRDGQRFSKALYVREAVDPKTGKSHVQAANVFENSGGTTADNYGPKVQVEPAKSPRGQIIDVVC
jgi:hypothetical protein